jgi:hypothetical protein
VCDGCEPCGDSVAHLDAHRRPHAHGDLGPDSFAHRSPRAGRDVRGIVSEPEGPAADGKWTATVKLLPCVVGEPCGIMDWVGLNAAGGEISTGCALTFVGMWNTKYQFQESPTLYLRGE